jgi:cytochrome c-type biogenesis protein
MDLAYISVGAAFVAGIISFLSPCLLPLVPIYISYLGGSTVSVDTTAKRWATLVHALLFVIGFSTIFIILGASVGFIGDALQEHMLLIRKIGGILLIVLGLQLAGVLTIPLLSRQKRFDLGGQPATSHFTSLLLGVVFGFAWTPCVGPTLVTILALAMASETAGEGAMLLAVYSAGLAIPFLVTAVALGAISAQLRRLNQHLHVVSTISGLLVIFMGVLLILDQWQSLSGLLGGITLGTLGNASAVRAISQALILFLT